jgi:hypothetical protein
VLPPALQRLRSPVPPQRRTAGGQREDDAAFADLVAELDADLLHHAASGAGTSIVALSDSSEISGSSAFTVSPGLT